RPFDSRHVDLASQRGLRHIDRNRAVQIVLMPLEERMLLHLQKNVQVALRAAVRSGLPLARKPQAVAVVDPRRNVYLQFPLHLAISVPPALRAWIADDLPAAVARAAGSPDRKEALLVENLTAAVARGALARPRPRFAAATLA